MVLVNPLSLLHTGLSPSSVDLPRSFCLAFYKGGWSAFARHYSPNIFFSSGYLDVSVPQVPFHKWITGFDPSWVSPFRHPWLLRLYTPHHGFSQCITSFIGSWCQGIHHVPFFAFKTSGWYGDADTLASFFFLLRLNLEIEEYRVLFRYFFFIFSHWLFYVFILVSCTFTPIRANFFRIDKPSITEHQLI